MVSKRQLTKTDKSRKVLHENLQNCDRLDISDLLTYQIELINDIIMRVTEMPVDQATSNYIHSLVSTSNFMLETIQLNFLNQEF